jgi:hypothetical protein
MTAEEKYSKSWKHRQMGSFVQEWRINIYRGAFIVRTPGTNRVKRLSDLGKMFYCTISAKSQVIHPDFYRHLIFLTATEIMQNS